MINICSWLLFITVLLWFWTVISPKGLNVRGLVPNVAMFEGWTLGKCLDHEGSDLISGLSHWLIHSLINLRKGLALSGDHEMRSSPLPRSSAMVFCLIIGPKAIRPRGHGLKVLKLWAKIKLSSFYLISLMYFVTVIEKRLTQVVYF
jgi:hypothetical protein